MKQLINRGLSLFLAAVIAFAPIAHAAQETINHGTTAGDGSGETLYSAFGKVNSNFTDLYTNYAPLASPTFTGTVSGITKGMVGLGNVDNTSDASKPVSTAVAAALPQFHGSKASFPASGTSNVLYVASDTGIAWRWTGSAYVSVGGVQFDANSAPKIPVKSNTLAVVGDSITSLYNDVTATGYLTNNAGYLTWALALSGQRMNVVSENSQGGSGFLATGAGLIISAQMDAAIASGANHLLILAGENDFLLGLRTVSETVAAAKIQLDRAVAAGMTVWWATSPPVNSSYASYSSALQGKILGFNQRIRELVNTQYARSGVHVVDMYSSIVDPLSATGSGKSGWSFDGQHPINIGARIMGVELARLWNLYVPEVPHLLLSAADQYGYDSNSLNLIDNGLFINGAAPGTGFTVAATGGATSSNTLVARADGYGNDLQMAITFPAAGTYEVRINNYKTRIVDGDVLSAGCEVTVASPVNIVEPKLTIDAYTTGGTQGTQATRTAFTKSSNSQPVTTGYTAVLKTPPLLYTVAGLGGINSSSIYLTVEALAAGSATVKIGRLSLRKALSFE